MRFLLSFFVVVIFLGSTACGGENEPPEDPRHYRRMPQYSIYGFDVSKYQKKMNWAKAKEAGIEFAFVKATEGATGKDAYFQGNWAALKEQHILRGAYHFFRAGDSLHAVRQAQSFIATVDLDKGDFPPVLDIEIKPFTKKQLKNVKIWLRIVQAHYKVKPIIYTSQHFYNSYLKDLTGYPLWIAKYAASPPKLKNQQKWLFWQFTDSEKNIFAVSRKGEIDVNVFRGDYKELVNLTME